MKEDIAKVIRIEKEDENTVNRSRKHQHGFVSGRSCVTNLLQTFEAWTRLLDEGFGVDVIYLDYSKALDSFCHNKSIE